MPPTYPFIIPRPVAMLDLGKRGNRKKRRDMIFGKGGKRVREWDK